MDFQKFMQKRELVRKQKREQKVLAKERERHHKAVLKQARNSYKEEKTVDGTSYISLHHIDKIYPNHVQAVYDFNLDIKQHEFIVFVGPSGCGKSTTLRMIAGLEDITAGDLFIDGVYANELPPKDREIGMVFQSYALYPHMTVYDNMAFALKVQGMSKNEIDERIQKAAKILEISEYLDRKPAALSGGQCQRVALGRAIVTDAKVFLMDEPLSNLDAKLRVTMRSELVKLHNALEATTIYVTHDQTEAMTMADRIVVMSKGYVQQIGTPEEIFNKPKNIFVATFIGSPAMNLINVKTKNNSLILPNGKELDMGNEFNDRLNIFYQTKINEYNIKINEWKDELLNRFIEKKVYRNIFKNELINKGLLFNLVSSFNSETILKTGLDEEKVKNVLNIDDKEQLKIELNNILREYLFASESEINPLIKDLLDKQNRLKESLGKEEKDIILGIRPEHIIEDNGKESFECKVSLTELLGSETFIHLDFPNKELLSKLDATKKVKVGDTLSFAIRKDSMHLFDPITCERM